MTAENRKSAEASWRVLRSKESIDDVEPFNFYVHRASKTDPQQLPQDATQFWYWFHVKP
jgi:hypothetical protein